MCIRFYSFQIFCSFDAIFDRLIFKPVQHIGPLKYEMREGGMIKSCHLSR